MNNPLGVSPSKGNRKPHGKGKQGTHRGHMIFSLPSVVPSSPLLGLTPSGLFMGLSSTLIYTSELILCSTIFIVANQNRTVVFYYYTPHVGHAKVCYGDVIMFSQEIN